MKFLHAADIHRDSPLAIAFLAKHGRTSQVILFTHHDGSAALAAGQAGVAVQRLPALAAQ
jgi:hypothetical protein